MIASKQQELFGLTSSTAPDQVGKKIVDLEHEIEGLQRQYHELEAKIAQKAPRLKDLTHSDAATLASVQQAAAQGHFDILYYLVDDPDILLWHINGSEVHVKKIFLPRPELMAKVAALRESMATSGVPFDEEHARQLYLFLIQPAMPFVRSRHLVVIPHEELNSIPFQALLDPEKGKFLGETHAISYAPSATVLQALAQSDALRKGTLLAVAEPEMSATTEEVNAIGKLYPNRSKTLPSATKADLKTWVGDYNVVHLSMHGKFDITEPLFSYLQLKPTPIDNGRLTAAEMFGLPLKKNSVVVLSACETGLVKAGHSNDVDGVVRALLYAGAGTLVLSQWRVNSVATKDWMQTFYREAQTVEPAEAARLALLAVKSQPQYSHPYFWAPFVVTGK